MIEIKITPDPLDIIRRTLCTKLDIKFFELDAPKPANKSGCQIFTKNVADMISFNYLDNTFTIIQHK